MNMCVCEPKAVTYIISRVFFFFYKILFVLGYLFFLNKIGYYEVSLNGT